MKNIRNFSAKFLAMTFVIFAVACSSSKDEAEKLLATVPADSPVVMYADVEKCVEKALLQLDASRMKDERMLGLPAVVFHNRALVAFADGRNFYITGLCEDEQTLKSQYSKQRGGNFISYGDFQVNNNCGLGKGQFWICLNAPIKSSDLQRFADLSEKKSFLENRYKDKLLEATENVSFYASVDGLLSLGSQVRGLAVNFDPAMARQVMAAIFEDASFVCGEVKFQQGKCVAEARVLDSKFNSTPLVLPLEKINKQAIKDLGGKADVIAALSLSSRTFADMSLIKAMVQAGAGISIDEIVAPLNGTIAVALSGLTSGQEACSLVIETNGKDASIITGALEFVGLSISNDGKYIRASVGTATEGSLSVAEQAGRFSDAYLGIVYSGSAAAKANPKLQKISSASLMFQPDGKGVKIRLDVNTSEPAANFLQTLINL